MEREAVLVGIDVGTTKVCALIGEVSGDGALTIIGKGTVPATGLKKGVVVNIEQTISSIAQAVEQAERLSGWKIDRAFVGVGGQHVESLRTRAAPVAVSGPRSRGQPRGRQPGDRGRPGGLDPVEPRGPPRPAPRLHRSTARKASRTRSG